jgi:hypothetical protein
VHVQAGLHFWSGLHWHSSPQVQSSLQAQSSPQGHVAGQAHACFESTQVAPALQASLQASLQAALQHGLHFCSRLHSILQLLASPHGNSSEDAQTFACPDPDVVMLLENEMTNCSDNL